MMPYMHIDVSDALRKIEQTQGYVGKLVTENPAKISAEIENEIKMEAARVFKFHTGKLYQSIGRKKMAPNAYMVYAGGGEAYYACLPDFQEIPTYNGFKKAGEVELGEWLFGSPYGKVTKIWEYDYSGILLGIRRSKSNWVTWFTPDHKILSVRGVACPLETTYNYYCRPNCKFLNSKRDLSQCNMPWKRYHPEYIRIGELGIGDFIAMPRIKTREEVLDELEFDLTPDLMRLIGYYLAEGHYYEPYKQVYFSINEEEEDFKQDIISLMNEYFNAKPFFGKHKNSKALTVGFSGLKEGFYFFKQFGKYAYGKYLPEWIFYLPDEYQRQLILGMYIGDGYHSNGRDDYISTSSPSLAMGLIMLFEKMGYPPTVYVVDNRGRKQHWKHLTIETKHRAFRIGLGNLNWVNFLRGEPPNKLKDSIVLEDYVLYRIKEIRIREYEGKIYDWTVEPDHYFRLFDLTASNCYQEYGFWHVHAQRLVQHAFFWPAAQRVAQKYGLDIDVSGREMEYYHGPLKVRSERVIKHLRDTGIRVRIRK